VLDLVQDARVGTLPCYLNTMKLRTAMASHGVAQFHGMRQSIWTKGCTRLPSAKRYGSRPAA
jgi:hypothetical protein